MWIKLRQAVHRTAQSILSFLRNALLAESVVLVAITLVWRLTSWYTTTGYGSALTTTGEIIIGLGLLSLLGRRSSGDVKLTEGEIEMRSWEQHGKRWLTSRYAELSPITRWLIVLGILTVGIGMTVNLRFT